MDSKLGIEACSRTLSPRLSREKKVSEKMAKVFEALFGAPKKSPEEEVKEWRRQLSSEQRKIDGQVRKIQREEQKAVVSAKQAGKQGDNVAVRMLAKEILGARKAVEHSNYGSDESADKNSRASSRCDEHEPRNDQSWAH